MATLSRAHQELFRRKPDECYESFDTLYAKCRRDREESEDLWVRPDEIDITERMSLQLEELSEFELNDWSFSQLCRMARVSKETINRLSGATASQALGETLPQSDKPLQFLTLEDQVRSVHGASYTRLWNAELLDLVKEFASDFSPPQTAMDEVSTGLYCGEQDMFASMIDPTGWAEIEGEDFAPGFFLWNSEVGRRSLGIQTFWFQRICQNHIVWDATEVIEFTRKHTANVRDGLFQIRRIIEDLVSKRDQRRDSFVKVLRKAMVEKLGADADEVLKHLSMHGLPRGLVSEAMKIAEQEGGFTIFALVDALTRLTQRVQLAGDRTELDAKIGQLLALAV